MDVTTLFMTSLAGAKLVSESHVLHLKGHEVELYLTVVAGPNGAAILLGMKRSTLQVRMQKLGIARSAKPI